MFLVYKCATTGLPLFGEPDNDPGQPHIVRLAAILCDDDGDMVDELDKIVAPDGWEIPEATVPFHGITTEGALRNGEPELAVLQRFLDLAAQADRRVAHNEPFDSRIIRYALARYLPDQVEAWATKPEPYCTMKATKDLLAAEGPPPWMRGRAIKVQPIYEYLIGGDWENEWSKDAAATADCVRQIYVELQRRGAPALL